MTNLAGEFGYQFSSTGFSGGPSSHFGIASSGYLTTGLPHDIGNFSNGAAGTDLDGNVSLDGADFTIYPTGVVSFNNGGVGSVPIVENEVDFVLSGLPAGFKIGDISNLSFQYGTGFDETNLAGACVSGCVPSPPTPPPAVPEPASIALLGLGLLGLGVARRRV